MGNIPKPTGDCFEAAVYLMQWLPQELNPIIVHGEATGRGKIEGIQHAHAWVEVDDRVFDFSNGKEVVIDKDVYYAIGRVKNTVRYSQSEANAAMLNVGTFGPWDQYLMESIGR